MDEQLELTPFEELMLHQDTPAYPSSCFVRMHFRGQLLRDPFESAMRTVIARHPLLRAAVDDRSRRPRWCFDGDLEPELHWHEGEQPVAWHACRRVDLTSRPGWCSSVLATPDSSQLFVQLHHSCCDGIGLFQVLNDLLIAYAMATEAESGHGLALPDLDLKLLRHRGSFGLSWSRLLRIAPRQAVGLLGVRQFLMRRPQPLVPHEPVPLDSPPPTPFPAWRTFHFDEEPSLAIRQAARRLGVTMNDLLARDLFLALRDFRPRAADEWLRLMIPVNLRDATFNQLPAANVVSSVFLDRRGSDLDDPQQVLTTVQEEMQLIKRLGLGLTFVFSLQAHRWVPGGLQRAARPTRCQVSAVLTNPGRLFTSSPLPREAGRLRCGNVLLDSVEVAAPIAPYMAASFAVASYADRLGITLHHDPRFLPAAAAEQLLARYVERIRQSAGSVGESSATPPLCRGTAK